MPKLPTGNRLTVKNQFLFLIIQNSVYGVHNRFSCPRPAGFIFYHI